MIRERNPAAEITRQGIADALRQLTEGGGVVLVGREGKPFAFYPPRHPAQVFDPGAPARLLVVLEARVV